MAGDWYNTCAPWNAAQQSKFITKIFNNKFKCTSDGLFFCYNSTYIKAHHKKE